MGDGVTLADEIMAARPRVIAALAGRFRDLDRVEDGFADACEALLKQQGKPVPANVAGWLYVVACRRLLDCVRRDDRQAAAAMAQAPLIDAETQMADILPFPDPIGDDRLRLIFTCTHPSIAADIRIALVLRIVLGVPMDRLAAGLLLPTATLYQRLGRAKAKIRDAGIGFDMPPRAFWPDRLSAVLTTLELGYAIAYQDSAATLDGDLGPELRRISALLSDVMPDEPEVLGLAALIELGESRRAARVDATGAMVPLSRQDVTLWDDAAIRRAHRLLDTAATIGRPGPQQTLAAIHLAHARRKYAGDVDWTAIVRLYDLLAAARPGPVTAIARAVALARRDGAAAGLAALDAIDAAAVSLHRPWHSARAHLLAEIGDTDGASASFARALALSPPPAERAYLAAQVTALKR